MKLSLDEWRRARNKSQDEMARACGVHINTYRKWEENPANIKYDKMMTIVEVLNISLDDIFFASDTTQNSKREERSVTA